MTMPHVISLEVEVVDVFLVLFYLLKSSQLSKLSGISRSFITFS
jgi:hypothetical protein